MVQSLKFFSQEKLFTTHLFLCIDPHISGSGSQMRSCFIILFTFYIQSIAMPKGCWQRVSVQKVRNSKQAVRTKSALQQEKEYKSSFEEMTSAEKQNWLDEEGFTNPKNKKTRRRLLREGFRYSHPIYTICEINFAQRDGETDLVEMLLAGGHNDAPLCQAVCKKDSFLVETLLSLGANPFDNHHAAIKRAIELGLCDIVDKLLRYYGLPEWDILYKIEREYTDIVVEESEEIGVPIESALEILREWLSERM